MVALHGGRRLGVSQKKNITFIICIIIQAIQYKTNTTFFATKLIRNEFLPNPLLFGRPGDNEDDHESSQYYKRVCTQANSNNFQQEEIRIDGY